jgi:branched-chain amino acid transport system substrate-binding protein
VLVALLALAGGLVACGDDDSGSSDGGTAAADTAAGGAASGEPIKIGNITAITGFGGIFEPFLEGLQSYVDWKNENGGVDGRPLELISLDDGGDPAKNAALARQLVDEDGVVALVGEATPAGGGGQKFLEQKGVASLGGWAVDATWTSPNMFQIVSGPYTGPDETCPGWASDMAKAEGATTVAYIGLDFPLGKLDIDCHAAKGEAIGLDVVTGTIYQALDQADYRPAVRRMMDAGAEDIIASIGLDGVTKLVQAAEQLGFTGKIFTTGGLGDAFVNNIGEDLAASIDGRIFGPSFALLPTEESDNADLAAFKESVPAGTQRDLFSVSGWGAGVAITDAIEAAGVDRQAILDYASELQDYDAGGLIAPVTYAPADTPNPPGNCILRVVYEDGELTRAPSQGPGFSCSEYIP